MLSHLPTDSFSTEGVQVNCNGLSGREMENAVGRPERFASRIRLLHNIFKL
jgi:hypothetical protein